jgi:hypothetical protein
MKIRKPFEEMDEDEYLFGKLTSDGSDVHLFFEEQHLPKGKKRRKIPEKRVDVDISDLEVGKVKEDDYEGIIIEEYAVKTGQDNEDNRQDEQALEANKETQNKPNKMFKMTLRELFNHYYDICAKESWKKRWAIMMDKFASYIPDRAKRKDFLQENFKRKRHNLNARKNRFIRKCSINGMNYFVTFTYDDEKMTAEQFKKKLRTYLRNKVNRRGWKYFGVWEGWDGSVRLHFHALMFIEDEELLSKNFEERKYNPVTKQVEMHTRNQEFNEKFGLSTIEEIIPQLNQSAYDYIGKYMDKGGKAMWSRNIPTFIRCAVRKRDVIGPTNEDETSFLVSNEAEIVTEYGESIKLNKGKVCKVLPHVTTCN